MSQWIKCSDRLPQLSNDDEVHEVLLCNVGQLVRIGQLCKYHGEMVWECDRHIHYLERFSHWMPLPPPPEAQP